MLKKAFTLVELIVVTTILSILGTIAFISFHTYSINARDGIRIDDLGKIMMGVELFSIQKGYYPKTTAGVNINYSGSLVWRQGTFGEDTFRLVEKVNKIPTDPLTGNEYAYSRTHKLNEYEVGAIFEGSPYSSNSIVSQANAASKREAIAYIKGDYNGILIKVATGSITYVLAVPTIIGSDLSLLDIERMILEQKLAYDGYRNLPAPYADSDFDIFGGFDFNPPTIIIYSTTGSLSELSDTSLQTDFMDGLQAAYSGTNISTSSSTIARIMEIDTVNDSSSAQIMAQSLIHHYLDSSVAISSTGSLDSNPETTPVTPSLPLASSTKYHCVDEERNISLYYSNDNTANNDSIAIVNNDGSISVGGSNNWAVKSQVPVDTDYTDIYMNYYVYAAIKADGSIDAFGTNDRGGDDTEAPSGTGFTQIVSTVRSFAALKDDGSISVWGWDAYGGNQADAPIGTGYTQLFANKYSFVALSSTGTIHAWGHNNYGGDQSQVPNGSFNEIHVGTYAYAAIRADGSIGVWGNTSYGGDPSDAPSGTGYTKIYNTNFAFAAMKADGSIDVWGNNTWGGNDAEAPSDTGYIDISSNLYAFAAIKGDGSMAAWGDDTYGGDQSDVPSGTGYTKIYNNGYSFAALKDDGSIDVWGHNTNGGNDALAPSGTGFVKILPNREAYVALHGDGHVESWGDATNGGSGAPGGTYSDIFSTLDAFAALTLDGHIEVWGYSDFGGDSAPSDGGYTQIYGGCKTFGAAKDDGTLTFWGYGEP